MLVLEGEGFSPYDDCYVYWFRSEHDGSNKEWWLFDSELIKSWQQRFEATD
jgi:hypothetical protein